ncbi:MAG: Multifunctional-autoprocessing repeats-in-toxin [Chlamydiae bacterium]|nr:Multifunctional-autoprocessing repeats-in-toxin [Chlamydiota bacterium]
MAVNSTATTQPIDFQACWPKALDPTLKPLALNVAKVAWNIFSLIISPIAHIRLSISELRNWAFEKLIDKTNHSTPEEVEEQGDQLAQNHEIKRLSIKTPDGTTLDAGFFEGDTHTDKAVLFVPGLGSAWQSIAEYGGITTLGTHVLALSVRGFGLSEKGDRTEKNYGLDVWSAYQYLIKEKGIDPSNILVVGHSFGGAAGAVGASLIQEEYPEAETKMVHWSSFSSLAKAVKHLIKRNLRLPLHLEKVLAKVASLLIHILGGNINSVAALAKLKQKVVVWAREDRIIPMQAQMKKKIGKPEYAQGTTYALELVADSPEDSLEYSHSRVLHPEEELGLRVACSQLLGLGPPGDLQDHYIRMTVI